MEKAVKTMVDVNGSAIPVKYVSAFDRARDRAARRILKRFEIARKVLERTVEESIVDMDEIAGMKEKLGERGNFLLTSFDGLIRCSIRQQYNIMLDERVAKARELMLGYINGVLAKVGDKGDAKALGLIVAEAFRANPAGILSSTKILALLRMEIDNADWREAKALLQDALKPVKGKRYISCERRERTQDDFKAIRLDIADCWPRGSAS